MRAMKKPSRAAAAREADSAYFLKILLYFVLSTIWLKHDGYLVFPLGLVLGLIFTRSDHFAIDRKIEYAILIIGTLLSAAVGGIWLQF